MKIQLKKTWDHLNNSSMMMETLEVKEKAVEEKVVAVEEGVTILLRADAVMLAGPESNITSKVADRLNKKTK